MRKAAPSKCRPYMSLLPPKIGTYCGSRYLPPTVKLKSNHSFPVGIPANKLALSLEKLLRHSIFDVIYPGDPSGTLLRIPQRPLNDHFPETSCISKKFIAVICWNTSRTRVALTTGNALCAPMKTLWGPKKYVVGTPGGTFADPLENAGGKHKGPQQANTLRHVQLFME